MIRYIIIIVCLCSLESFSQIRFNNTYDLYGTWDRAYSVNVEDDGYFIGGTTAGSSGSNYKIAMMKIDLNGNLQWKKNHSIPGVSFDEVRNNFVRTYDSCYAFAGSYLDATGQDVVLIKFNSVGDTLWQKTYGDTAYDWWGYQCKETADKGFVIVGSAKTSATNTDLLILKTDSLGNFQWKKNIHVTIEIATCVQVCDDGGFFIGGMKQAGMYNYGWLVKTDSMGIMQWQQTLGGLYGSYILDVRKTLDGGYIGCGFISDATDGSFDLNKSLIVKLTSTGSISWQKEYGRLGAGTAFETIYPLADSSYIVCGENGSSFPLGYEVDATLLKISKTGDTVFYRNYNKYSGPATTDFFHSVRPTPDGGFIVAGDFYPNFMDMWVLKLDSLGCDSLGCQFVGINEPESEDLISIFPNPGNGQFNFSGLEGENTISIYEMTGKLISHEKIKKTSFKIDLAEKNDGIYLFRIEKEGKLVKQGKLLKN